MLHHTWCCLCCIHDTETQLLILSPIAPHICEYIWTKILQHPTTIVNQRWPSFSQQSTPSTSTYPTILLHITANLQASSSGAPVTPSSVVPYVFEPDMHRQLWTMVHAVEDFRKTREKSSGKAKGGTGGKTGEKKKGGSGVECDEGGSGKRRAVAYVSEDYLGWQQVVLKHLQQVPLGDNMQPPGDFMTAVKELSENQPWDKQTKKQVMSFASFQMREELPIRGRNALDLRLPFDEAELLRRHEKYICKTLDIDDFDVRPASGEAHPDDKTNNRMLAIPGKPSLVIC
eukprot:GHVQ01022884.1.p1 GENE.GHVQ01022884.1~~GHVQ01022884.1.p1  ORF type:complete len:287 (+),score=52.05 GHVQ01022884.1:455-1315(+)